MKRAVLSAASALAVLALLAGCASASSAASDAASGSVQIVASTNVWGSVAQAIGGDLVTVTSLIDSSAQDPHEFEATARDQLALSHADLIVENGGGYDAFMTTMLAAAKLDTAVVVNAAEVSGLLPSGADPTAETDGFNEHVWYDFGTVDAVAKSIADSLAELAPSHATEFASNYATFSAELTMLAGRLSSIASTHKGESVAITEPVPLYMLTAAGFDDKTPVAFSAAIEEGSDVSPLVLRQVTELFADNEVEFLAYNDQTVTSQTEAVLTAAQSDGIPVVGFAETLPDDATTYIGWMTSNVDNIAKAVSHS